MKLAIVLTILAAFPAQAFEGIVTSKQTEKKGSGPVETLHMKMYFKDMKARMEMTEGEAKEPAGIQIIDFASGMTLHLDPKTKTYSELNVGKMVREVKPDRNRPVPKITKTGKKRRLHAGSCEDYLSTDGYEEKTYCVSKDADVMQIRESARKAFKAFHGGTLGEDPEAKIFEKVEGFPILTIEKNGEAPHETIEEQEIRSIEKVKVCSEKFQPMGYKKISMQEMIQQQLSKERSRRK